MATNYPITASGSREPEKRPRPIPAAIKAAVRLLVHGTDDVDGKPMDLVEAARLAGVKAPVLRRYLMRPAVIAFLRAERRAFREAICSGNENALRRVRDSDSHSNPMARVAAVRALEGLEERDPGARPSASGAGITIKFINAPAPAIDVSPPTRQTEQVEHPTDPVFRITRW